MNSIIIDKLIPGGQGIGTDETGKKGLFWNVLPDETVTEYTITKNKSHYFEAIATKIENINPHRIGPKDECFLSTSPWQIMDYDYELAQKAELLKETFRQVGFDLPSGDLREERRAEIGSPPVTTGRTTGAPEGTVKTDLHDFFYRNKMEYALFWDNAENKIHLAFHQRGSHRKIPITTSSIERPEIFAHAQKIVDTLNARGEEARKYQSILLRCNKSGQISGGLLENYKPHPIFDNLKDTILGHEYSYSPNGFFQINLPVYEMALEEIKNHIKTDKVLDLYAGVGTIGLSVARDKNLTLVECNKAAFRELVANSKSVISNGPGERVVEQSGDPREAIRVMRAGRPEAETIVEDSWASTQQDPNTSATNHFAKKPTCVLEQSENALNYIAPDQTVILDPPRAGCDKKLMEKLITVMPKTIIYLSCNPATQARDVKILSEKYQITKVVPFNFFPRTPHLENLIILEKML